VTCRELGAALQAGHDLPEAVTQLVVQRLKTYVGSTGLLVDDETAVPESFRKVVGEWFDRKRVFLLVDGWDERNLAPESEKRLHEVLRGWAGPGRPLLLTSRMVGVSAHVLPGCAQWQLMPLEAPQGPEQLIDNFFGPGSKTGQELIDELRKRPQLWQMVRIPLLGALVCWMRQRGRIPPVPGQRTMLLDMGLRTLLEEAARPGHGDDFRVPPTGQLLAALGQLACNTFQGERWVITPDELYNVLETVKGVEKFGGAAAFGKALTGKFGLFTETRQWDEENQVWVTKLELLHQSFAELLCAWAVKEAFFPAGLESRWNPRGFRKWLRREGGLRFLDPRWHEVWCHLAAFLPDVIPLLEHLWSMHKRSRRWWRPLRVQRHEDDRFGTALGLAGCCLAAHIHGLEMTEGRDVRDSPIARRIVTSLETQWKCVRSYPERKVLLQAALGPSITADAFTNAVGLFFRVSRFNIV
jgi:hypothetical protein